MYCTLFAIVPSELGATSDASLPAYDEAAASTPSFTASSAALELGEHWPALHVALGDHGPDDDDPLGFLEHGGEPRSEFAGQTSSGRYFDPALTVQVLAALARIAQPARDIERLRVFVADIVRVGRGMIVYHFR